MSGVYIQMMELQSDSVSRMEISTSIACPVLASTSGSNGFCSCDAVPLIEGDYSVCSNLKTISIFLAICASFLGMCTFFKL